MRWSIIRLIWARELRDQLRDRRTVFMVVVLPLLLYPILGFGLLQFALGFGRPQSTVGVVGIDNLPADRRPPPATPAQAASWLAAAPVNPGSGIDLVAGAAARAHLDDLIRGTGYPPLLVRRGRQPPLPVATTSTRRRRPTASPSGSSTRPTRRPRLAAADRPHAAGEQAGRSHPGGAAGLPRPPRRAASARPSTSCRARGTTARAWSTVGSTAPCAAGRRASRRLRLLRRGLPADFDDVFAIDDPERAKPAGHARWPRGCSRCWCASSPSCW